MRKMTSIERKAWLVSLKPGDKVMMRGVGTRLPSYRPATFVKALHKREKLVVLHDDVDTKLTFDSDGFRALEYGGYGQFLVPVTEHGMSVLEAERLHHILATKLTPYGCLRDDIPLRILALLVKELESEDWP